MERLKLRAYDGAAIAGFLTLPPLFFTGLSNIVEQNNTAVWLAMLVAAAFMLCLFLAGSCLMARYEGWNIIEITAAVMGKPIGVMYGIALGAYFCFYTGLHIREGAEILKIYGLVRTPLYVVACLLLLTAVVMAFFGGRAIIKSAGFFFILVLLGIIFVLLLGLNRYNPDNLVPALGYGLRITAINGLYTSSMLDGVILLFLLAPAFSGMPELRKSGALSLALTAAAYIALSLCFIMMFSPSVASKLMSGVMEMGKSSYYNHFFYRFEAILLFFLIFSLGIQASIGLFAAGESINCTFKLKPAKTVTLICAVLILIVIFLPANLLALTRVYLPAIRQYSVFFMAGFPLLALLISALRKLAMRGAGLFLMLICLLSLCGCWDKRELEDNTFAVLLGLDAADGDNIVVTAAFPLTQTGDSGEGGYSVMSVKAPTIVEGLNMFNAKLSGALTLYSIKTIVISEELARHDMLSQVFSAWRYQELRNTTNVLISECTASEFIKARVENAPIDPMRQEELLLEQANDSANYKPVQLLELLSALKSDSGDGVAMYGGLAAKAREEDPGFGIDKPVKSGYLPGELPIAAENETQISGLAVFRGAELVGVLDSREAQAYSILTGSKAKKILTVADPLEPHYNIAAQIFPVGKTKIRAAIHDGVPAFTIESRLKCGVECIQSQIDYTQPENYAVLTEYIRDICEGSMTKLITKVQKEYGADILRLGDKLAYQFNTVGEWEAYGWAERYKDAEINLEVSLEIEHSGIMMP